jgi:hypothetical protein
VSRRELAAFGAAAVAAATLKAEPAQAFLGFGEGAAREEAYKNETVSSLEDEELFGPWCRQLVASLEPLQASHRVPPFCAANFYHIAALPTVQGVERMTELQCVGLSKQ